MFYRIWINKTIYRKFKDKDKFQLYPNANNLTKCSEISDSVGGGEFLG